MKQIVGRLLPVFTALAVMLTGTGLAYAALEVDGEPETDGLTIEIESDNTPALPGEEIPAQAIGAGELWIDTEPDGADWDGLSPPDQDGGELELDAGDPDLQPEPEAELGEEPPEGEEPRDETLPEEEEAAAAGLITPTGIGGPGVVSLSSPDRLGDWLHYNGLIFGDMTSYQADAEGALAIGGSARFGLSGGYDVGGSYNYSKYVHLGEYTNGDEYPTLLLGGRDLSFGNTGGAFNVFGGPIALTQNLYDIHAGLSRKFSFYPLLNANGSITTQYFDWVIGEQNVLDAWFDRQYQIVSQLEDLFARSNDSSISLQYFSQYKSSVNQTFSYIEDADALPVNPYRNQRLANSSGQVDEKILVVNVACDPDVWFSDPWSSNALPVSAEWAQQYELIVFNFNGAVNVRMTGNPQIVTNGLGANKTWPDGNVSQAAADERHAICERVIYNFPDARNIDMDNIYLMGTLMAPNARLEADGGSINGQLICNEFITKGAMELHALRLTRYVEELYEPEDDNGCIRLHKYVYDGGATTTALDGAEFVLLRVNGGTEEYYAGGGAFAANLSQAKVYSPKDGEPAVIEGVPQGEYLLREITAPSGYLLNDSDGSNKYTYFETAVTVKSTSEEITVNRYNAAKKGGVYFQKVDADNPAVALEGAVFALFRIMGVSEYYTIIPEITSGGDGLIVLENLTQGRYELREVSPPDGYMGMNTAFVFDLLKDAQGEFYVRTVTAGDGEGTAESPILLPNASGTPDNTIYLYKYGENPDDPGDTGTALAGAKFDLYQEEPEGSGKWTKVETNGDQSDPQSIAVETNGAGLYVMNKMPPGRYRLVETAAPEGYYLENGYPDDSADGSFPDGYAYEFAIDPDSNYQRESIPNRPKTFGLRLEKVEAGESGTPLSGAVFSLSRYDSGGWTAVNSSLATAADGTVTLTGLQAGRYRLEETSAPAGHSLLDPAAVFFTVTIPDDEDETITVQAAWGEGADETPVGGDTSPVSMDADQGSLTFRVENNANIRDLVVYKIDRDIFQVGVDQDDNKTYQINYLEGAEFRLQRRSGGFTGDWADYGGPFTSQPAYRTDSDGNLLTDGEGNPIPETDEYGNPKTKAVMGGLAYGAYRLVETKFPDGYRPSDSQQTVVLDDNTSGYLVYTFTITEAMAEEEGGVSEYTIHNTSDKPRSRLTVYKVDSDGNPLPNVPFKLWKLTAGAEDWKGDMTLEEVMARFDELEFVKYSNAGGSSSFYTGSSGVLALDSIEPGVYVLFEHFNEIVDDYLRQILYLLSHETTVAEPEDASFYLHTTVFKVVAVDDSDPSQGVRIQWVDRNKLWNGEAVFDNDSNNVENGSWTRPAEEDDYRSITVVNKKLRPVDLTFTKTDADSGEGLEGAVFTLYEKTDFTAANGTMDAYRALDTATSGPDGAVRFTGLAAGWKNTDGSAVAQGYRTDESQTLCAEYMIAETTPPTGYKGESRAVYLRLELNPLSKMLDLYLLDGDGAVTGYQAGYTEPAFDPDTKEVFPDGEGNPVTAGTFVTSFALADFTNEKAYPFSFRKVGDLNGSPLEDAAFALYACGENHTHTGLAGEAESCWQPHSTAASDENGLVAFPDLPSGSYQLAETTPPPGYALPEGQWRLQVDADAGTVTITAAGPAPPPAFLYAGSADPDTGYWLLNREEFQLPLAGGGGIRWQLLLARSLLYCAAALLPAQWLRRKTTTLR